MVGRVKLLKQVSAKGNFVEPSSNFTRNVPPLAAKVLVPLVKQHRSSIDGWSKEKKKYLTILPSALFGFKQFRIYLLRDYIEETTILIRLSIMSSLNQKAFLGFFFSDVASKLTISEHSADLFADAILFR